jgi:hypothetical protein
MMDKVHKNSFKQLARLLRGVTHFLQDVAALPLGDNHLFANTFQMNYPAIIVPSAAM